MSYLEDLHWTKHSSFNASCMTSSWRAGSRSRKWASNSRELLSGIPMEDAETTRSWTSSSPHSVLGIEWLPFADCFQVTAAASPDEAAATKRTVLSKTAQLFDPLGWLTPVTIMAKILIQELWLLKSDWGTPLPPREEQHWSQFMLELPYLSGIQIPRWLGWLPSSSIVEVHGFADASERAYAAVIYLRVVDASGTSRSTLVTCQKQGCSIKAGFNTSAGALRRVATGTPSGRIHSPFWSWKR